MANLMTLKCNSIIRNTYISLYPRFLSTTFARRNEIDKKPNETVEERPKFVTAQNFREIRKKTKFQGTTESSHGVKPTKTQKRMLVFTRMFKSQDEIPEHLSSHTMKKLSDRIRIAFILVGCTVFFIIALFGEKYTASRIERDKRLGVVVTKM